MGNSITDSEALHDDPVLLPKVYENKEKELTVAYKADRDKLRFDLIPTEVMEEIADIYTFGSRKYSDWNWAKGFNWGRVYAAMQRHLHAWHRGEDLDPESGRSHMVHAAWNALSLIYHIKYFPQLDDRHKRPCVK
jgi:hypothetical protein